jgi:hypothetical protein
MAAFYTNYDKVDHRTRVLAYLKAMDVPFSTSTSQKSRWLRPRSAFAKLHNAPKNDTKIRLRRQEAERALPSPISAHGDQPISAECRRSARF